MPNSRYAARQGPASAQILGPLTEALATLPVQNAIIGGEVVFLDANGKSVFVDLMRRRKAHAILYCFDALAEQ